MSATILKMHNIDALQAELERVIEQEYPIKEGKSFVNSRAIVDCINEHPEQYPIISKIKYRGQKIICTVIMKDIFGWKQFSKSGLGTSSGSVFIRPEITP